MNEETFNLSLRKFLKMVGVRSQNEIEKAVASALAEKAMSLATAQTGFTCAAARMRSARSNTPPDSPPGESTSSRMAATSGLASAASSCAAMPV
ncbi:DUF6494 family protein [Cupriavidus gilardii]